MIKNQHFIEYFRLLQTSSECEMHLSAKCTFLNRFICLVKFHSKYFNCNTDNILHFHVNFQQHSVAFIRLLPQYYNKID